MLPHGAVIKIIVHLIMIQMHLLQQQQKKITKLN